MVYLLKIDFRFFWKNNFNFKGHKLESSFKPYMGYHLIITKQMSSSRSFGMLPTLQIKTCLFTPVSVEDNIGGAHQNNPVHKKVYEICSR